MIPLPQPLFITFPVLELELVQAEQEKIDFEIQYEMVQSPLDTAHKRILFFQETAKLLRSANPAHSPSFLLSGGWWISVSCWDMAGPKSSAALWDLAVADCSAVKVHILPNSFYLATINLPIFREM